MYVTQGFFFLFLFFSFFAPLGPLGQKGVAKLNKYKTWFSMNAMPLSISGWRETMWGKGGDTLTTKSPEIERHRIKIIIIIIIIIIILIIIKITLFTCQN